MTRVLFFLLLALVSAEMPEIWLQETGTEPKIINGQDANEGEFPFMVSFRRRNASPGHSCGGTVLTANWVMTAAHCCAKYQENLKDFYVYAGSIYLSKGGSNHSIGQLIIHDEYTPQMKWKNDICVVKLSQPLVLGAKIKQTTLAPHNWSVNSKDLVTVVGWGRTKPALGDYIPDRLQKGVNFTALSVDECSKSTNIEPYNGYLCARGTHKEQCTWNGDSGGPLVKNGVQVGITSFGFRPFGLGTPTVYSRVSHYADWIKASLGSEASQLKFYTGNSL